MKHLAIILYTITALVIADEVKKPEPMQDIVLSAPKKAATYNPNTKEWKLEKGFTQEDVFNLMLAEIQRLAIQIEELKKSCPPTKVKAK